MATTTLAPRTGAFSRSWVMDWLTTVDHKKIGILYILNSFLFFFAAGILALVIRSELWCRGCSSWTRPPTTRPSPCTARS